MTARYQVILKNTIGDTVALLDHWYSLSFLHKANDRGDFKLSIDQNDDRVDLFVVDGLIEVWRRDQQRDLDWYLEWEGFCRKRQFETDEEGREVFTCQGVKYLDLIKRRHIMWAAESTESDKTGVGETVIKEYVDENAGPGATTGAGRLVGGATSGLAVEVDNASGGAWQGDRSYEKLLEVIQDIGRTTDIFFDVIGQGKVGGIQTFQFNTYVDQRGEDRSEIGLDQSTGLNGAGNAPVIFTVQRGNMKSVKHTLDNIGEVTSVLMLGSGVGAARVNIEVVNATAGATSPWNHIELVRNRSDEGVLAALTDIGDNELLEKAAKTLFEFEIIQTENTVYGRDFSWGDLITARYRDDDFNLFIRQMAVTVEESGEVLVPQFDLVV